MSEVLNSSQNANVVNKENIDKMINITIDELIDVLSNVCGPYSKYGLLIKPTMSNQIDALKDDLSTKIFLKDGRQIVSHINYVSPLQDYLKNIIAYIGKRVDNACKDGTTTAMLFACYFLKYFRSYNDDISKMSTTEIQYEYNTLFSNAVNVAKDNILITVDDIKQLLDCTEIEARFVLGFIQAYTSSNGNLDIAYAIAKYFTIVPKEGWSSMSRLLTGFETIGYDVFGRIEEYEAKFEVTPLPSCMQFFDMDGYYRNDNIDMLVLQNGVVDYDGSSETLEMYLNQYVVNSDKDLMVFIPHTTDNVEVLNQVVAKCKINTSKIIFVYYHIDAKNFTKVNRFIFTMLAKANKPLFNADLSLSVEDNVEKLKESIIPNAKVLLDNRNILIYNFTSKDDRLSKLEFNLHPGEIYPEDYKYYTYYKTMVKNILERELKNNLKNEYLIEELTICLHYMSTRYRYNLVIGGLFHDQQAIVLALEDAMGASLASMNTGMYFTPIYKLPFIIEDSILTNVFRELGTIIYPTIALTDKASDKYSFYDLPLNKLSDNTDKYFKVANKDLFRSILSLLHNESMFLEEGVVNKKKMLDIMTNLQLTIPASTPANWLTEVFNRVSELILKVGLTHTVIIPNTEWDRTKE